MVAMNNSRNPLFLEAADRVALSLCRDAFWDGNRCTWLGWAMETIHQKQVPAYRSFAGDFYGGTSGIALFLAEQFQFTQDRQILRTLEGAVNQALSVCESIAPSMRHGFYSGQCGVAYAFTRIGSILRRERLVERGLALISGLRDVQMDGQFIDVIAGSAGAIPALLHLAHTYQRPDFVELAVAHGDHLLALAERGDHGWSWNTLAMSVQGNLTGHSHGVAGIVTAMLELHNATGEQRFLQAAMEGLRYETHLFCPTHGNWPDLRNMGQTKSTPDEAVAFYNMAWCHGAPGIGLSRLRNAEILKDNADVLKDLEAAIQTTANSLTPPWVPGNGNYSLCHGAAGNAELMIMAGQKLNRPELTRIAEKVGEEGIEFYVKQGLPWPCGNGGAGETPNLMLGTAGIGHFYLRLYDPVAVPSVLIITP